MKDLREAERFYYVATMLSPPLPSGYRGRSDLSPPTFIDQDRRTPYKKFQDSQSLLDQILIRSGTEYVDMAEFSPVVASAETFEVCRVYISEGDIEARQMLENIMRTEQQHEG